MEIESDTPYLKLALNSDQVELVAKNNLMVLGVEAGRWTVHSDYDARTRNYVYYFVRKHVSYDNMPIVEPVKMIAIEEWYRDHDSFSEPQVRVYFTVENTPQIAANTVGECLVEYDKFLLGYPLSKETKEEVVVSVRKRRRIVLL